MSTWVFFPPLSHLTRPNCASNFRTKAEVQNHHNNVQQLINNRHALMKSKPYITIVNTGSRPVDLQVNGVTTLNPGKKITCRVGYDGIFIINLPRKKGFTKIDYDVNYGNFYMNVNDPSNILSLNGSTVSVNTNVLYSTPAPHRPTPAPTPAQQSRINIREITTEQTGTYVQEHSSEQTGTSVQEEPTSEQSRPSHDSMLQQLQDRVARIKQTRNPSRNASASASASASSTPRMNATSDSFQPSFQQELRSRLSSRREALVGSAPENPEDVEAIVDPESPGEVITNTGEVLPTSIGDWISIRDRSGRVISQKNRHTGEINNFS